MTILTIWTLVLAGAIVLVLAVYLIAVAIQLLRASRHLAALASGLTQVRNNTAPLEERLATIAGALSALKKEFAAVDEHLRSKVDALGG